MDLRQEAEHIFGNGLDWYQRELGEVVLWHEFLSMQSTYDSTYDEGGRLYSAGLLVPALWVIVTEDRHRPTAEGRKPTEKLTCAISMRLLEESGISDPEDYTRRLNDIVRYENRLWKVTDFNIRGRVPDPIIVGVTATQIFPDEEMVFDDKPPGVSYSGTTRRYAYPNERPVPTYPDHELPAPNGTDMYSYYLYKDFDTVPADDGITPEPPPDGGGPSLFSINVNPDLNDPYAYNFGVSDAPDHKVDWDFGDGTTVTDCPSQSTIDYTYNEAGEFVVTAICHKETTDVVVAPGAGYGLGQYGIVQPYGGYPS